MLVTKKHVSFQGKTISLGNDIDLSGHQWFPIGCDNDTYWGQSPFKGTFDGRGHTIRNLYIENGWHGQALFGLTYDACLKNFTVRGSVTTGWKAAGVAADTERTTLENIVNYCDVTTLFKSGDGGYASTAGGIVAYVVDVYVTRDGAKSSKLVNLKNYGTVTCGGITEQGGGVGGIAGSLLCGDDDQEILVSQCENHGTVNAEASNYVDMYAKGVGGIVGSTATYGNYRITDCSNTGEVKSANLVSTGGIAGSISGLGSAVTYCYNAGNVNGASPDEVASTGGIVGRSVAAHTGNTTLDITSCYNVGAISGRGGNVSAILGVTSGYAEDWDSNDGGTTVNNVANYYVEDSVQTTSETGVLFQRGTVEMAQPVSAERINSQEVIDALNETDSANDHYTVGSASPKLELKGSSDLGVDDKSSEGEGTDEQVYLNDVDDASQKETHMYAISMEQQPDQAGEVDFNATLIVLLAALVLLVAAGCALQLGDYRAQTRPLRAVLETSNKEHAEKDAA